MSPSWAFRLAPGRGLAAIRSSVQTGEDNSGKGYFSSSEGVHWLSRADRVIEILGIDDDTISGLLDGTQEWPPGARERLSESWGILVSLGAVPEDGQSVVGGQEGSGGTGEDDGEPAPVTPDSLVPAEPAAAGPDASNPPSMPAETSSAPDPDKDWDQRRVSLFETLQLARMRQIRGRPYHESVALSGLVAQVELILISFFGESVPEPGEMWNAERRELERDKRVARLRWVQREQEREFTGFRGLANWLLGRKRLSWEDLARELRQDNAQMEQFVHASRTGQQNRDG